MIIKREDLIKKLEEAEKRGQEEGYKRGLNDGREKERKQSVNNLAHFSSEIARIQSNMTEILRKITIIGF